MTTQAFPVTPVNGASPAHDLFALTDEQILEIEPQEAATSAVAQGDSPAAFSAPFSAPVATTAPPAGLSPRATGATAQQGIPALQEPPAWLAARMKDPWGGEEARELWEGVQRAQAEAAEYRAAIATTADAKTLKELYPGGVEQARTAAQRARTLDDFDAAYFGAPGKSPQETSAARGALAQRMLREDPAAFRDMVTAGLKALEEINAAQASTAAGSADSHGQRQDAGLPAGPGQVPPGATQTDDGAKFAQSAQIAAYSEFEKSANAELEKSVGGAIERALRQALPNAGRGDGDALTARLSSGVHQEIEKALQGDRQLGEQVAQVLASRRFDDAARAQVVRLIQQRAQQLLPGATKRVLHDWTQTTLAAHRSKTEKRDAAGQHAGLSPAREGRAAPANSAARSGANSARSAGEPARSSRVDYKKLSDEQILDL